MEIDGTAKHIHIHIHIHFHGKSESSDESLKKISDLGAILDTSKVSMQAAVDAAQTIDPQ